MFTVFCAPGRVPGWVTQGQQLGREPHQRIGRPMQLYSGTPRADLAPLEQRAGRHATKRRPDAAA